MIFLFKEEGDLKDPEPCYDICTFYSSAAILLERHFQLSKESINRTKYPALYLSQDHENSKPGFWYTRWFVYGWRLPEFCDRTHVRPLNLNRVLSSLSIKTYNNILARFQTFLG